MTESVLTEILVLDLDLVLALVQMFVLPSVSLSISVSVSQYVCQSAHQSVRQSVHYEHLKVFCGWVAQLEIYNGTAGYMVGVFGL